ncbi:uncharacterized protein FTJAE_1707 [Fusarium tjaetaba]|uniref:Uncharacterized protein n=1 Tax=Fusarium tjaetaba TaxID=1567544 RepID=A0A8H5S6Z1_9HYPO|nr:uncharacterized protein FTJAE_1707 [Fusarium tjaetaba]KAF5647651.1 hypothetical protein FTJAE_1707 [Fusarium tjaetaba]
MLTTNADSTGLGMCSRSHSSDRSAYWRSAAFNSVSADSDYTASSITTEPELSQETPGNERLHQSPLGTLDYNQADGSLVKGAQALRLTSEGRWILRNFAYHDIIGSVMLGTKPLLCPDYLRDITYEFDTYLGVASKILVYIGQTTCLSFSTNDAEVGIHPSRNYLGVQHDIESWTCPAGTPPTLQAAAYAYRGAALIYLY